MKAKGDGPAFILQTYEDRLNNQRASQELSQKLSERLNNLNLEDRKIEKQQSPIKQHGGTTVGSPPPPPPPPQPNDTPTSPSTATTISTLSSPQSSTSSTRSNTLKNVPKSLKNDSFTQSLNNAFETNTLRSGKKGPPVPVKYSVLSYRQEAQKSTPKNGTTNGNGVQTSKGQITSQKSESNLPPPCPTPDYDTLSLASTTSSSFTNGSTNQVGKYPNHILNADAVEMQSLESFRLDQPNDIYPKPPNIYFQKRPLSASISNQSSQSVDSSRSKGSTTLTRNRRPVSVTIGEYPTLRRQPSKLDFLQNGDQVDNRTPEESLSSRLTSELTQTLNRSNLMKRTESMENLLAPSTKIENQINGTVRISLSMSKAFAKSTNDLTSLDQYDSYETMTSPTHNRVTINVNQSDHQSKSSEPVTPNGILKNGSPVQTSKSAQSAHKAVSAQKSITFGEMPIVIKDKSTPT